MSDIELGEIELEGTKRGGKSWLYLGIAIGLVVGMAIGYYVNVGTLQYAYKLLESAQPPPPDMYLVAFKPGQISLLTPMGSPIFSQPIVGVNGEVKCVGENGEYTVLVVNDKMIYVLKSGNIYSALTIDGLVKALAHKDNIYAITNDRVILLKIPDLTRVKEIPLEGRPNDAYLLPEEPPKLYVLLPNKLVVYDALLNKIEEFDVGGSKIFVGAYYFFVVKDGVLSSFKRSGEHIADANLRVGEVLQLRACRGILLVLTKEGTYAYRVPTLDFVKKLDVTGRRMRADPLCTIVYVLSNSKGWAILMPSLSVKELNLPAPFDDIVVRFGGAGGFAVSGGRQIALSCG